MAKDPKLLIFDFDGTIADTHHYAVNICNHLSKRYRYQPIKPEEIEPMKDWSVQQVIDHLEVPWFKLPRILSRAKKEFFKNIETIAPIENLHDTLAQVHASGHKIGILSSNAVKNIQHFLQEHDLVFFDFVRSCRKIWGKDRAISKVVRMQKFSKKNTLYIGDEVRDIIAAKKAGVHSVAVGWGFNSLTALKKEQPDYILNSPQDLIRLCERSLP